ncbi:MAG: right-handed parallel beta-helix repeat-containing protein, partial [Vicinamibacteraceae bacterium]
MTRRTMYVAAALTAGLVASAAGQDGPGPSWEEPVRRQEATAVVIGGLDDLREKLAAAQPGDVVWIGVEAINLDPPDGVPQEIELPPGVTLAGGRSALLPGPVLYTRALDSDPEAPRRSAFRLGDGARVTGLQFEGPSGTTAKQHDVVAITVEGPVTRVQVDRSEFFNWTRAGVFIEGAGTPQNPEIARITRNYFHHNQAAGNGYGVNVRKGAYPLIDRNTFDYNRHAISCDGRPETGYRAYGNFVLQGGHDYRYEWHGIPFWVWDQHFDMHGQPHDGGTGGLTVSISRNTFRGEQTYGLP